MSENKKQPNYSRQMAYEARQRKAGLTRAGVWVPARDLERLRTYAARLCKTYEKESARVEG